MSREDNCVCFAKYYKKNKKKHLKVCSTWQKRNPIKFAEILRKTCIKRKKRYRRIVVKARAGGCCICGYKKSMNALHFHHLKDKLYAISKAGSLSEKKLRYEIKKCIVVCANCHAEIHDNAFNPQDFLK